MIDTKKTVAIIIPCYNQSLYLCETLDSVINQTFREWECLIVNDGSTDNTEKIALEYCLKDPRFKYLKKGNGGLSSARNAGIKISRGEYIQFLDSDDLLEKYKIEEQRSFLNSNPDVDIVYSSSKYFFDEDPQSIFVLGRNGLVPTINMDKSDNDQLYPLLWRNVTTICSTLYRRSVLNKVPSFDENLHSLEDWDFHFRCARAGLKFHFQKERNNSGVLIRLHNDNMLSDYKRTSEAYNYLSLKMKASLSDDEIDKYRNLGLPDIFLPMNNVNRLNQIRRFIKRKLWGSQSAQ